MYNFPEYVTNNKDLFKKLSKTRSEKKKNKIIKAANPEAILGLIEIIHNVLKANYPLSLKQRKKLSKHANFYRHVSRARTESTAKKRLQKGGSVAAIGTILAPVLGALGQYLLDKTLLKNIDNNN